MNWEQEDTRRAADLLERAADVLVTDGWTKGRMFRETPRGPAYCAMGAIGKARKQLQCRAEHQTLAIGKVTEKIIQENPSIDVRHQAVGMIPFFNDVIAKKVGDVTDVLLAAAKDLRNSVEECGGRPA